MNDIFSNSVPSRPPHWAITMDWHDLLFAHWPVDSDWLAGQLPRTTPPLELDTHEGRAWIGVVPFRMSGIRWRWLPPFPGTHSFAELNVRTYVRVAGLPGVWFFSLDATSKLAVRVARATYHLPYFDADMQVDSRPEGRIHYRSRRTHPGGGQAGLEVEYGPTGDCFTAQAGTLEHWLTERYRLFAADPHGRLRRGEIQHEHWPLQPASARFDRLDMTRWMGLEPPAQPPHLLFARHLSVRAFRLIHA